MVLIREDNSKMPRIRWDLGVIRELFPGKDGITKGPVVRSIQRLHDLELVDRVPTPDVEPDVQVNQPVGSDGNPETPNSPNKQSTRCGRIINPVKRFGVDV